MDGYEKGSLGERAGIKLRAASAAGQLLMRRVLENPLYFWVELRAWLLDHSGNLFYWQMMHAAPRHVSPSGVVVRRAKQYSQALVGTNLERAFHSYDEFYMYGTRIY
eukprot:scaffold1868_cov139-Skeletonema_dohrnii-CCMP3373.AAC.5